MYIGWIDAPGQAVERVVVASIRETELDAVKRLFEGFHHVEDDGLVIVFLQSGEIEIGRKASLAADDHFPQACPALECEPVQYAALREELEQVREHDFLFRDHDVAETGFNSVSLNLGLREHLSAPFHGPAPAESGTAAQLFPCDVDKEVPRRVIADRSFYLLFGTKEGLAAVAGQP